MQANNKKCSLATKIWGQPCQNTEGTQKSDSFLGPFVVTFYGTENLETCYNR